MQFDMYHHYTVDEHSIRAIGLLAAIERGELADDHPLSTALFRQLVSRRSLYVAVLLHDIAKGRGGDHSELAPRSRSTCARASGSTRPRPRWSRGWSSITCCCRTPPSPRRRRPQDDRRFCSHRAKSRAARLLLILTVVDIRAVGPTTWTEWKGRCCAPCSTPPRNASARPQAARAKRPGRRAPRGARRGARLVEGRL